MTTPDYLPQLRHGTGETPKDGGCLVQVAGFLYDGHSWRDDVPCVHPVLRRTGIIVNDSLTEAGLRRLSLLTARISGSGAFVEDWTQERKSELSAALARWSAEYAAESAEYAAEWAEYAAEYAAKYAAKSAEYAAESAAKSAERDGALIAFYTALVDEFDRLTGRTSHELTEEQAATIRDLIGVS